MSCKDANDEFSCADIDVVQSMVRRRGSWYDNRHCHYGDEHLPCSEPADDESEETVYHFGLQRRAAVSLTVFGRRSISDVTK